MLKMSFSVINYRKFSTFFNRKVEVENLLKILRGKPTFTLITGSNDTGKTRLIKYVLEMLGNQIGDKLNLIEINLRIKSFNDHLGLRDSILDCIPENFFDKIKSTIPKFLSEIQLEKFKIKIQFIEAEFKSRKPKDMSLGDLLDKLHECLKDFSWLNGGLTSVLYIDEANILDRLNKSSNPDDVLAYNILMQWILKITKESEKVHVVFGTSDSYYAQNLINLMDDRINDITIGDLTFEDSLAYFLQLDEHKSDKEKMKILNFEKDIYPYVGGRMFKIENAVLDYLRNDKKGPALNVVKKCIFFYSLAFGIKKGEKHPLFQNSICNWSRNAAIEAFKQISEKGYISLKGVDEDLKYEYFSLVQKNFLNFRNKAPLIEDIDGLLDKEYSVLVAPSRTHQYAMGKVLNETKGYL